MCKSQLSDGSLEPAGPAVLQQARLERAQVRPEHGSGKQAGVTSRVLLSTLFPAAGELVSPQYFHNH